MEKNGQISYRIEKGRLKGVLIFLCELVTVIASKNKSTNGKSNYRVESGILYKKIQIHF